MALFLHLTVKYTLFQYLECYKLKLLELHLLYLLHYVIIVQKSLKKIPRVN